MPIGRFLVLVTSVWACRAEPNISRVESGWRDPSPHVSQMVTITHGVAVEVLDWGGRGRPLVFLAGLGNSPHVYDTFAPAFTDCFRVYGITRRGFGHSTGLPVDDPVTLVSDLRTVLDSLRLSRVVLVGHSIGGEELTGLGSTYPDRCEALVYLDAAYDRSWSDSKLSRELDRLWRPAVSRAPMRQSDSASRAAVEAYYARNAVHGLPEAEVRAVTRTRAAATQVGSGTTPLVHNGPGSS